MAKTCPTCGRPKHEGLCDMVTLSDGRIVHASRVDEGGDLHDQLSDDLKVENRWIKKFMLELDEEGNVEIPEEIREMLGG